MGDRKGERNTNIPDPGPRRRIELRTINVEHKVQMLDAVPKDDPAFQDPIEQYRIQAPSERNNGVTTEPAYAGDPSQCFTDVAIIDRAVATVAEPKNNVGIGDVVKRRLSLSEPAQGYPYKFRAAEWNEKDQVYKNAESGPTAIDIPLDGPIGGATKLDANLQGEPRPFYLKDVDPVLTKVRNGETSPNVDPGAAYSFIYLQRLANPLLPWNPLPGKQGYNPDLQVNPYLTVDSTSANLTVFNSRGDASGEEEDGTSANAPRRQFASHERGYTAKRQSGSPSFMPELWSVETPSAMRATSGNNGKKLEASPPNRYAPPFMQPPLRATNSYWFNAVPTCTLGFLNRTFADPNQQNIQGGNDNEAKKVKPRKPFPWLTWNNRPYVSGNELLLVPRSRSSKLLRDFATAEDTGQGLASIYADPLDPLDPTPSQPSTTKYPFAHLENYFYVGSTSPRNQPVVEESVPVNLSRVLDYVQAPSLFEGTQTWLNPQPFNDALSGSFDDPRYDLQPPFNTVSEYREPGRINLNTIASKEVWDCLFHGSAKRDDSGDERVHAGPDDDQFAHIPAWSWRRCRAADQ